MIKIVQFGEGNFLRTFVDLYFDTLNKEGGEYKVNIIKPIPLGSLEKFKNQNYKYHVVLRGVSGGKDVENVYKVDAVESVFSPFEDNVAFYSLAREEELKIIVSNTTEAGICFSENDKFEDFETATFPAKLTKFLYERYKAGKGGVYLLPVELIENNADELYRCVKKYIELWGLPEEFKKWNAEENYYCNTLVDRIVSGYPRDDDTRNRVWKLIGEKDELVSIGEPFGLWAVEKKGNIAEYIREGEHNIEVILTGDINYYKKRKVRVLNGSHTNLVAAGLWHGAVTVYDCLKDDKLCAFFEDTLRGEIVPFVSDDIASTQAFAQSVKSRFLNPFLNHQLTGIALNSISKWKARNLPSFKDYYKANGKIPPRLTIGFSYLMALYKSVTKEADGKFYVRLPSRTIPLQDDVSYLEYFANGGGVVEFMKNDAIWGEDLTAYKGFAREVEANVEALSAGRTLL